MKKKQIILGVIALAILYFGYSIWSSINRQDLAKAKADSTINNLDKLEVINDFSARYFPKEQIHPILSEFRESCDWKSRRGKFVDFYTMKNITGTNQTALIYEYLFDCDSLRFILTYQMESDPVLSGFMVEPIENENRIIVRPENQLKY